MIDVPVWMVRDKRSGKWAFWGQWVTDTTHGGSVWYEEREAQRYVDNLNAGTIVHGIEAELVPLRITDGTASGS